MRGGAVRFASKISRFNDPHRFQHFGFPSPKPAAYMSRMPTFHRFPAQSIFLFLVLFMPHSVDSAPAAQASKIGPLQLTLRSRKATETNSPAQVVERRTTWDPHKTVLIICDMWDDHWCKSAAARVGELAGPMNQMIQDARRRGILILHAPSSVTTFYKDTPQRKRAQAAPFAKTPAPLSTSERWGTMWCWPDAKREKDLPIDDADMGCDCATKCTIREAWTREIATLEIAPEDVITDNGQETWNVLAERGIDHILIAGVHLNMCVLGRPFGIRQMVTMGKDVALVRDMTDTMYDPRNRPKVSHFEGTKLVIGHVEQYWCPSVLSTDLTGRPAFHFKGETSPR